MRCDIFFNEGSLQLVTRYDAVCSQVFCSLQILPLLLFSKPLTDCLFKSSHELLARWWIVTDALL